MSKMFTVSMVLTLGLGAPAVAGPTCAVENGDVNGDGARDLSDAVFLLAWRFNGGAVPVEFCDLPAEPEIGCAVENGDTNGDKTRDLSDAIFLLTWRFSGGAPPVDLCRETAISGRVLDANDAAQGTETPIVGVTVTLLRSGVVTSTDAQGVFILSGVPSGNQVLDLDASTALAAPSGDLYASFREAYPVVGGVTNVIARPLYLPRLDGDSATAVDPTQTTVVHNPNINATLTVPPFSAKNPDGSDFTGELTISRVPQGFAPAELPDELEPGMLVTIQPVGVTFDPPAPLTLADVDSMAAGNETNLWSLDPDHGIFTVVGRGEVQADGTIDTVSGGVLAADWHAMLAAVVGSVPNKEGNQPCGNCCDPSECPAGSSVQLKTGVLSEEVELPSYSSQSRQRQIQLRYSSHRAHPTLIEPLDLTVPIRFAVPETVSYRLSVGGVELDEPEYVDTSGFSEVVDETFRVAAAFDASTLATGVYPSSMRTTSNYQVSSVSARTDKDLIVVNEQDSPLGAGWSLSGLQRIHVQSFSRILLTDGDGTERFFDRPFEDVDLRDWTVELDQPVGTAIWDLSPAGDSVTSQVFHAFRLSTFVSPFNFIDSELRMTLRVNGNSDDDLIGLVLGYNSPLATGGGTGTDVDFILLDWRRSNSSGCLDLSGNATEGLRLSRFLGFVPEADICRVFWSHEPQAAQVLATHVGEGLGWDPGVEYEIKVAYESNRIVVDVEGETIFDVTGTFPEGRVGFYNLSQPDVTYRMARRSQTMTQVGPAGDTSTITANPDGTFTRRLKDGTEIHFDSAGRQTARVDRNGNTTSHEYDGSGLLEKITDPVGLETLFFYSGSLLETIIDPAGRVTLFDHDAARDLIEVTFPDGANRSFEYDEDHLLVSQIDRRGFETTYEYDAVGRLVRTEWPDGSERTTSNAQSVGLVDPESGLGTLGNPAPVVRPEAAVANMTDGEGRTSFMSGDRFGQPQELTDPVGLVTTTDFSPKGQRERVEKPSGHVTRATYDEIGNQLTATDEVLGGTFTLTYEPAFNQIETVTDPFDKTATFGYDASGNLTSVTTPEGRSDTATYSAQGLVETITDRLGTTITFSYDAAGLLEQIDRGSGADQRTASINHTPAGYIDSLTDPESRVTSHTYDAMGRQLTVTLPDTQILATDWDAEGNLASVTPPGRPTHAFTYIETGELESYQPPAIGGAVNTDYTYNDAQELTRIDRPDGRSFVLTYDAAGRLKTQEIARGTTTYTYDGTSGLLSSIAAPGGEGLALTYQGELRAGETWSGIVAGGVSRTFDEAYRLATESVNGANQVTYGYDDDSLLTQAGDLTITRDAATGLISGTTLGQITDTWTYNDFGELESYSASFGATQLYSFALTRDKLGRIVAESETVQGVTTSYDYTYDARGRLERVDRDSVLAAQYTYDANSNRLSRSDGVVTENGTYDAQDRAESYGGATYTYRQSGELSSRIDGGGTTSYDYDELGNLLSVTGPDSTVISYAVDGVDRRIGKRINGVLVQGLLYRNQLEPVAELDGGGTVLSRFVYGSREHVPDYMVRAGTVYRIVSDQIGSVRLVVDTTTGEVAQRLDYDEFGRVLTDTNASFQPFTFAGGLSDVTTGLIRFGARDYDPRTGRWTIKDPLLFVGGDTNLFSYVQGDPMNGVDPTGTERCQLDQIKRIEDLIQSYRHELGVQENFMGFLDENGNVKGFDHDGSLTGIIAVHGGHVEERGVRYRIRQREISRLREYAEAARFRIPRLHRVIRRLKSKAERLQRRHDDYSLYLETRTQKLHRVCGCQER